MVRKFSITFLTVLTILTIAPLTHAQVTSGSISISPLTMELILEVGKSTDHRITVKNSFAVPYAISFEALDVEIASDTHSVKFLPPESKGNTTKSLASWVRPVGSSTFQLEPDQDKVFSFRLEPPQGISPGDFYASLNFYYQPVEAGESGGRVQVRQSLGSLILVSVAGTGTPATAAQDYTISEPRVSLLGDSVEVLTDVRNNTLRYIHLKPLLSVVSKEGNVVYQKDGKSKRVFPGEATVMEDTFPQSVVALAEGLTLKYSLRDARSQTSYFESSVSLDNLSASWLGVIRQSLLWITGALILIGLAVLMLRGGKGDVKPSKRKRK